MKTLEELYNAVSVFDKHMELLNDDKLRDSLETVRKMAGRFLGGVDNVYEFTGTSENGLFKLVGTTYDLKHITGYEEVPMSELGLKPYHHYFVKNWETGDIKLMGEKPLIEGQNKSETGYRLLINSYAKAYRAINLNGGVHYWYVGGFTIV